jgi:2',3'-cyclic-nucleotide 2'-phosphodiesterase (5'-nucleotidase family)
VVERRARLQPTYADQVTPDPEMLARIERWNAGIAPIAATVIGRNARRLVRSGDATVGYLVSDAMRQAVGADIVLQNSGGLRADLPEGDITLGGIYEVMPFDNTIVTMDLTGAEVRRALEEGLKYGRVAQVSGLRYTYDNRRPEMQRLVTVTLADGSPLDDQRSYRVAVNNFMASGGDNYFTLASGRNLKDTQLTVRDAMESLVKAKCAGGGALDYAPEGRARRASDSER